MKSTIVTFRIPKQCVTTLKKTAQRKKFIGVYSFHQLSRKVVMDYLSGKLIYLQPA